MKTKPAALLASALVLTLASTGMARPANAQTSIIQVPQGYTIEKVVGGLTYPTGMTWDDKGNMYVAEAGGNFLEEPPPARIMRIEPGKATEVVNFTGKDVLASVVGLAYSKGSFYISHKDPADRTGAISRVGMDGSVTKLLTGFVDSQAEHQINDLRIGPDGKMYFGNGPAGNSGVVGIDIAPFVARSPMVHTTACRDIVLTGVNFETPDFRTKDNPNDKAMTGAYVPFGTATTPGQKIAATKKCGGAIFQFDPANPEGSLKMYAWGLRNVIGLAWDKQGTMYAGVNSYDVRGSRPVNDDKDATYRITEGTWYGFPDYSSALNPLTDPKYDVPDTLKAPAFLGGQPQKGLGFVIDHAASGLKAPDKGLIAGLHEGDSSPSMLDVAPDSWGDMAGQLFVAEWGDLAPATNPLLDHPVGYKVVRIDPNTKQAVPFVYNAKPGPASKQNAMGQGLERPFDVKFGPDGAMYISDYGVGNVNMARIAEGKTPYEFPVGTGAIYKVTRSAGGTTAPPPAPPPVQPPSQPPVQPPAPPAGSSGGTTPGMPRTGYPDNSVALYALVGAAVALATGGLLVRRRKPTKS